MQPRGGAFARPAKVTLCTFAALFQLIMPPLHMSSRTMKFLGLLTSQSELLISSQRRTWSSFAEAYDATARDFEISSPKYTLANIIQWHVSYEGNKFYNALEDLSQDPLILCLQPPGVLPEPGALPDSLSAPPESIASAHAHVQPSASSPTT